MRLRSLFALCLVALPAAPLAAQDPGLVEALAPIVMTGDRRVYDEDLLGRATLYPDPLVRRTAAMTIGRIGDVRGTALIVPLLKDRDRAVVADAFFALGLLRDTAAVEPIIARLRDADTLSADATAEAASALAKIGGPAATQFIAQLLGSGGGLPYARQKDALPNALLETWRLGTRAPVTAMLPHLSDTSVDLRWRAVYALGRLRVAAAGMQLLQAARDRDAMVRETAVKALTKQYADSAKLTASAVASEIQRAFDDESPGVRISALTAAASWRDSTLVPRMLRLLRDADPNVRVQAVTALGDLRGAAAIAALDSVFDRRDASWAMKRFALTALTRVDTARFAKRAAAWGASADIRERIAALEGWGAVKPASDAVFLAGLADADGRVQAAALGAWRSARGRADTTVSRAARERLTNANGDVRGAASDALGGAATINDLDALVAAWKLALGDPDSDGRLSLFGIFAGLSKREPELLAKLSEPSRRVFLDRPADALVRRAAEEQWPELSLRWGPSRPVETGRTLEDYRSVVRTYMLARENPKVTLEVEGKGTSRSSCSRARHRSRSRTSSASWTAATSMATAGIASSPISWCRTVTGPAPATGAPVGQSGTKSRDSAIPFRCSAWRSRARTPAGASGSST